MNTPLLLEPLADRSLNFAAIALHIPPQEENAPGGILGNDKLAALAAAIPCLLTETQASQLPAGTRQFIEDAGCRIIPENLILCTDEADTPPPPPHIEWVSGKWHIKPPKQLPTNQSGSRALELRLLQLVANDADTREIEAIFRQDPILAYQLLRLVNSIGAGMARRISSFSQAILILGRQQLKRWLNLMLFATNRGDRRSSMLMTHVAVRSRSMEQLARTIGLDRPAQEMAFMAGMFSLLGVLFARPLEEVLGPLILNTSLLAAVLGREGDLGRILLAAEAAENLDATALSGHLRALGLSGAEFGEQTLEAHSWMVGVVKS